MQGRSEMFQKRVNAIFQRYYLSLICEAIDNMVLNDSKFFAQRAGGVCAVCARRSLHSRIDGTPLTRRPAACHITDLDDAVGSIGWTGLYRGALYDHERVRARRLLGWLVSWCASYSLTHVIIDCCTTDEACCSRTLRSSCSCSYCIRNQESLYV